MASAASLKRLFLLRARLARALARLALLGLSACLLFALVLLVAAVLAGRELAAALAAGEGMAALGWSALAMPATAIALWMLGVLAQMPPPPAGVRLDLAQAPAFRRTLGSLGDALGLGRIHGVWLTDDLNLGVLQRPRWGWVGPLQTHLMIGLPFALSLGPAQFSAVLAQQLAHLQLHRSGAGARGAWWTSAWLRVLDELATRAPHSLPALGRLVDRITQVFSDPMLRLLRLEEYEADLHGGEAVGAAMLAEALVELTRKVRYLDGDPAALSLPLPSLLDQGPWLAARVRRLGVTLQRPQPYTRSAAQVFFSLAAAPDGATDARPAPTPAWQSALNQR